MVSWFGKVKMGVCFLVLVKKTFSLYALFMFYYRLQNELDRCSKDYALRLSMSAHKIMNTLYILIVNILIREYIVLLALFHDLSFENKL